MNVNGVRSAVRKGLWDFLAEHEADVVCLQEVRAADEDLPSAPDGYRAVWLAGERRGYSGVGVLTRLEPEAHHTGLGVRSYDREGRVLRLDLGTMASNGPAPAVSASAPDAITAAPDTVAAAPAQGASAPAQTPSAPAHTASALDVGGPLPSPLTLLNVYVPSGTTGEPRQSFKMRFLKRFKSHVKGLIKEGRELLIVGDVNIAHRKVDLKNWRSNQRTSGFLPEERAYLDGLLKLGLHDTVRELIGPETELYSWWSTRSGARERNVGWRLDYHFTTAGLHGRAVSALIPREPLLSDHAPVIVDYRV